MLGQLAIPSGSPAWAIALIMLGTALVTAAGGLYLMRSQRRGEDRRSLSELLEGGAKALFDGMGEDMDRLREELEEARDDVRAADRKLTDAIGTQAAISLKLDSALFRIGRLEEWIRAQGGDPEGINGGWDLPGAPV